LLLLLLKEAILVARKVREGETDPADKLGLSISLGAAVSAPETALIAELVKTCGFKGATWLCSFLGFGAAPAGRWESEILGIISGAVYKAVYSGGRFAWGRSSAQVAVNQFLTPTLKYGAERRTVRLVTPAPALIRWSETI
jgi:hypothetical protein